MLTKTYTRKIFDACHEENPRLEDIAPILAEHQNLIDQCTSYFGGLKALVEQVKKEETPTSLDTTPTHMTGPQLVQ